ncbi:B12 lower ligand biosynthesis radical SAM protei n BzaD [Desulfonema ishimotonii]|uniref:B12 lower ligand biosynthesis radical SAM protei n BzaD n=1 Tax=Desulfonema ishimotonii TaxID=45657 RepID=A0A401FZK2_9BACT|nr:radical SAM protein [Desulfonema ishimotonii]GBC62388.1 B12 lower ligand biosynthesis radical SAM protei n BzaD [Desulfonema ishimotonii]
MRILLVQVPTSHLGAGERVYPLGLSRLSGLIPPYMKKQALDMNLLPDPWPVLRDKLTEFQPDTVMLSFRNLDPLAGHQTSYLSSLKTAAQMARLLAPDAGIWAGGPAFSLFGERLMREIPEIDLGLISEGEIVFPKMISGEIPPESLPGVVWRKDGQIVANPLGEKTDLNALPPMDIRTFSPDDYMNGNMYVAAVGIEGKRGCDLQCGYCIYPCLGGRRMRLRSPEKIVDEMEFIHEKFGAKLFHFTDSVLNRPADHFEDVCRALIRRKLEVSWTGFFREDTLTQSQCDLALNAGLIAIYFSGDALSDHGLKVLNKHLTKADLFRASRITAESGVLTMCHFLMNLPGELPAHEAEVRETMERILEIHAPAGNLGAVILNTVRLYPGAPLTRRLLRRETLDPSTDLLYPVYYNPPATSHLLHELQARCHSAGIFSHLKLDGNMSF